MASVAEKRRRKRARIIEQVPKQQKAYIAPESRPTARPTPERMSKGQWSMPSKADRNTQPIMDMASDMIGALFHQNKITSAQEQAARMFSEVYAAYKSEIGVREFKSFLAGGASGHDGGDGNPAVYAQYYAIRERVGRVKIAVLQIECDKTCEQSPVDLGALRNALDCLSAG